MFQFRQWLSSNFDLSTSARDEFVIGELEKLPAGTSLLDAGAGNQPYRDFAKHLTYTSQDFVEFDDEYNYAPTDIVGNIWDIDCEDAKFDAVLCTEVLEHIPYPVDAIRELSRVLKPGGVLILTAPSNFRRHFDPFYFSAGFSDRWYQEILPSCGYQISSLTASGDFYEWMKVEIFRLVISNKLWPPILVPTLLYFKFKRPTPASRSYMCNGYHVVARKI